MIHNDVLYHHGVKGMKWGVRRYQYKDGTLTPLGQKRNKAVNSSGLKKIKSTLDYKMSQTVNMAKTKLTGKQYVDGVLKQGTTLSRIQTSENFEKFAFYATYLKSDSDKYLGLFGKNLKDRAAKEATKAEKQATETNTAKDLKNAKALREYSDNLKVYQLKLKATDRLKVPSDDNAADIMSKLLRDKEFSKNVKLSLEDSKSIMKRPTQQMIFKRALDVMHKDPGKMSRSEKVALYKAFNLSLTNHKPYEIASQNRFYNELKKKGYNSLLDYNDKEYSSYHAKRPMIVFDLDSVKLQSVTKTNPKIVNKMYRKYNSERILKEAVTNSVGLVGRYGSMSVSKAKSYVMSRTDDYLYR